LTCELSHDVVQPEGYDNKPTAMDGKAPGGLWARMLAEELSPCPSCAQCQTSQRTKLGQESTRIGRGAVPIADDVGQSRQRDADNASHDRVITIQALRQGDGPTVPIRYKCNRRPFDHSLGHTKQATAAGGVEVAVTQVPVHAHVFGGAVQKVFE
jgi:hypothetical protein